MHVQPKTVLPQKLFEIGYRCSFLPYLLPLLLSDCEYAATTKALRVSVVSETKLAFLIAVQVRSVTNDTGFGLLSKFPSEILESILEHTLNFGSEPRYMVNMHRLRFAGALGDASGFYFGLGSIPIMLVNRGLRKRAMRIFYRGGRFQCRSVEDLLQFLIAMGDFGRNNVEHIEVQWESRIDSSIEVTHGVDHLPQTHVETCLKLLERCKRLKRMTVQFDLSRIVNHAGPVNRRTGPGWREYLSLRRRLRCQVFYMVAHRETEGLRGAKTDEPFRHTTCQILRYYHLPRGQNM